ncbi:Lipoprotein signal peptidase [hydrothermal vent metagenome]|uniref:Lipoprotein signal peptidase n=1 Tax=hydrothermal vent metagenome TaxID=652676 RepID=A0A3B0YAK8_9ZZZZ
MHKWLGLSVAVIVLDQITKYLAEANLVYAQPMSVFPSFNLTLLYNPGAAFSFLSDAGGWQRWVFAVISLLASVFLIGWLRKLKPEQYWLALALALVLGGAVGNLIDRLLLGHVIDFIQLYYQSFYWPAFNIADAAISVGAVMLVWDALSTKPEAS